MTVGNQAAMAVPREDPGAARLADHDWRAAASDLDAAGFTIIEKLLSPAACREIAELYPRDALFRSRVEMARHGFGRGEYKYFDYPLPEPLASLRGALYGRLVAIANGWNARLGVAARYPETHAGFLRACRQAGQSRPTPLLLSYEAGDFNCLHQDLYGDLAFPIQVAVLLSRPGSDFTGGEFVLTEQRPRRQSRVEVVPLRQGDAVAFAVAQRPLQGARGSYRVTLRHGVSRLRSGRRMSLGLIFHDAR